MPITAGRIAVNLQGYQLAQGEPPPLDAISSTPPAVESEQLEEADEADLDVIVVEGRLGPPPGDPMIELNETVLKVSLALDTAFVEPIADSYRDDVPSPLRKALRNFFRNLTEPVNFINFLLQGKPKSAIETFGRFAINSTLGVGGLVDWAGNDNFDMPYQRNGFANTMGYYGIGPGPFLVLPLVGATTLRDALGGGLDQLVLPTAIGKPFNTLYYAIPAYSVNSLEFRIEFDDELEEVKGAAVPYDLLKQYYLERREREINALKGIYTPTMDELIEMDRLAEEAAAAEAAAAGETSTQQGMEAEVITPQQPLAEDPAIDEAAPILDISDATNGNDKNEMLTEGIILPPGDEASEPLPSQPISTLLANAGY